MSFIYCLTLGIKLISSRDLMTGGMPTRSLGMVAYYDWVAASVAQRQGMVRNTIHCLKIQIPKCSDALKQPNSRLAAFADYLFGPNAHMHFTDVHFLQKEHTKSRLAYTASDA